MECLNWKIIRLNKKQHVFYFCSEELLANSISSRLFYYSRCALNNIFIIQSCLKICRFIYFCALWIIREYSIPCSFFHHHINCGIHNCVAVSIYFKMRSNFPQQMVWKKLLEMIFLFFTRDKKTCFCNSKGQFMEIVKGTRRKILLRIHISNGIFS